MSSKTDFNLARDFRRTDPSMLGGHPLRGTLKDRIQRDHLLRREENAPERERIAVIRDTVIAGLGVISALIPLMIAFQSVTGA